jgi:hypothetical protein
MKLLSNIQNRTILVLFLFVFTKGIYAESLYEAKFPKNCETNVSNTPIIHIKTKYPIKASSLKKYSPETEDANGFYPGNVVLIDKNTYDTAPDSMHETYSVRCELKLVDNFNLYILGTSALDYDTEYTLKIKDNLIQLKPNENDPNIIDEVSENITFECLFRTKMPPLQFGNSIPLNGFVGCNDTLKLYANRKIDISNYQLENLVNIYKYTNLTTINDSVPDIQTDIVDFDISISADSMSINIKPVEIESDKKHILNVNLGVINGGVNPPYHPEFTNYSTTSIKISTVSQDTSLTLPDYIQDINGKGERLLKVGDTLDVLVPLYHGDFVFDRWAGTENRKNLTINANHIKVTANCDDMNPYRLVALYKQIPVDTLNLLAARNAASDTPNLCPKYVVRNFNDSINPYLYTYKRYGEKSVRISLNLCNGLKLDKFTFTDITVDTTNGPEIAGINMNPNTLWNNLRNQMGNINNRKINIGADVIDVSTLCPNKEVIVVIKYINEAGFLDEFDSLNGDEDIQKIFNSITINTQTFTQTSTPLNISQKWNSFTNTGNIVKVASAKFPVTLPLNSLTYSFELNDNYAIRSIEHSQLFTGDVHHSLTYGQYQYPKPHKIPNISVDPLLNLSSGIISVSNNPLICNNTLYITVTRMPAKVSYDITEKDGGKIPAQKLAWVSFNMTQPTYFMNRPATTDLQGPFIIYPIQRNRNNLNQTILVFYDILFKNNRQFTATRQLVDGKGWGKNQWKQTSGYTTITTPLNDLTQTLTTNHATEIKLGHEVVGLFRLDEIWTDKQKITDTEQYKKYYFSNGAEDGENDDALPVWKDLNPNEEGDGVFTNLPGSTGINYEKRFAHNSTASLVFQFSQPVFRNNLKNNFIVNDLINESAIGLDSKIRKDSYNGIIYKPKIVTSNINGETNDGNLSFQDNGKRVIFRLISNRINGKNYIMPHISSYGLKIFNCSPTYENGDFTIYSRNSDNTKGSRISNIDETEVLEDNPGVVNDIYDIEKYSYERHTTGPAIRITHKNYFIKDNSVTDQTGYPEFYYYSQLIYDNELGKVNNEINSNLEDLEKRDKDGNIVLSVDVKRHPSDNSSQLMNYPTGNILFVKDQLMNRDQLALFDNYIEDDSDKNLKFAIDLAKFTLSTVLAAKTAGVSAFIELLIAGAKNMGKNEGKSFLKDLLKTQAKDAAVDDVIGSSVSYISRSGLGSNWDLGIRPPRTININGGDYFIDDFDKYVQEPEGVISLRWVNWGVGPYGLYSITKREQFINPQLKFKDGNNPVIDVDYIGGSVFEIFMVTEF